MDKNTQLQKKKIELLTRLWIKPEKDRLNLNDAVVKNQITLSEFLHRIKIVNAYIDNRDKMFKGEI